MGEAPHHFQDGVEALKELKVGPILPSRSSQVFACRKQPP